MTRKLFDKSLELAALATTTVTVTVATGINLQMTPSFYFNKYQSHWEAKLVLYGLAIAAGTNTATVFTVEVGDDSSFTHKVTILTQDLGATPSGKYEFLLDFAGAQELMGTTYGINYIRITCTCTGTGTVTYGAFLTNC